MNMRVKEKAEGMQVKEKAEGMHVKEKKVTLTNHNTSERHSFVLRPFVPGDEEAVMQCVREEYGDSYYRREFYDRDLLMDMVSSGGLHLFVATCNGETCGIQTIISYEPEESRVEAASQIFKKKYRGYGLPFELVKYTYEYADTLHPSCIYASCVVFHPATQQMCQDVGMIPVSFNLGSHLTSVMSNSYVLGKSEKYAQAILVKPVDKLDAGVVYAHRDVYMIVSRIYSDLGVRYSLVGATGEESPEAETGRTELSLKVNDREQSVMIYVKRIGRDVGEAVRKVMDAHRGGYWTIQLILPSDDPASVRAYETLTGLGFFFTGIRPLCCAHEQITMQYVGDVRFEFDDFRLTSEFRGLLDQILKFYEERQ